MTHRTRIVLIFVTVAIIVGGGGFWFFKIHTPNQKRAVAREQIAAWDERWLAARTCLLGATPGSSKVSEALAIRELSPDPWERKLCTTHVSLLTRGDAEDTGLPAVEEAWRGLDKAASKLAMSFVSHVDPGGDAMRKRPDPLPVALDELEAAYVALRQTADLAPLPAPVGTAPLAAATVIPVELAGKRVLSLPEPLVTSRAGLLAYGTVEGQEIQLQLVAGKPPVVSAVGAGMQRAIPDGSWGARALPDVIEIGTSDAAGTLQASTKLALPGATQVISVLGT
ncbi:MAG: hypothetical protein H0X17_19490, partial [Deltaproteobacteria bacterium]|nr:hypothetical protein [Deltaproteobacteria bacterium]